MRAFVLVVFVALLAFSAFAEEKVVEQQQETENPVEVIVEEE